MSDKLIKAGNRMMILGVLMLIITTVGIPVLFIMVCVFGAYPKLLMLIFPPLLFAIYLIRNKK